jgi:hypothetical protein
MQNESLSFLLHTHLTSMSEDSQHLYMYAALMLWSGVADFKGLTNTKCHFTLSTLYIYSPFYSKQMQEYNQEDQTGQWLLKFTLSLQTYFIKTTGLSIDQYGQDELLAFSIKFCTKATQNCLWVILALHKVRGGSCWELSRLTRKNSFIICFHVSIVSSNFLPFCPLCPWNPNGDCSPVWFLAL